MPRPPLKHLKDPLGVLRLNADAVILHGKHPFISLRLCPDMNARRLGTPEFEGVTEQILEEQAEAQLIAADSGQGVRGNEGLAVDNLAVERLEGPLPDGRTLYRP